MTKNIERTDCVSKKNLKITLNKDQTNKIHKMVIFVRSI